MLTLYVIEYRRIIIARILLQPPVIWDGGAGFIPKEMIQTHCLAPDAAWDIQVDFGLYQHIKHSKSS